MIKKTNLLKYVDKGKLVNPRARTEVIYIILPPCARRLVRAGAYLCRA